MMDSKEYASALQHLEVLLKKVDDKTPINSPDMVELVKLSNKIEAFETKHFSLPEPNFRDRITFFIEHRLNLS